MPSLDLLILGNGFHQSNQDSNSAEFQTAMVIEQAGLVSQRELDNAQYSTFRVDTVGANRNSPTYIEVGRIDPKYDVLMKNVRSQRASGKYDSEEEINRANRILIENHLPTSVVCGFLPDGKMIEMFTLEGDCRKGVDRSQRNFRVLSGSDSKGAYYLPKKVIDHLEKQLKIRDIRRVVKENYEFYLRHLFQIVQFGYANGFLEDKEK